MHGGADVSTTTLKSRNDGLHVVEDLFVVKHREISIVHFLYLLGLLDHESFLLENVSFDLLKEKVCSLLLLCAYGLQAVQEVVDVLRFLHLYLHRGALAQQVSII
jgi:hypothetical protein